MNLPGKLTIGLLQEDNPVKFFFRIRPAFTREENGFARIDDAMESFPEDGYIRIVPDKNEISHFKNRMLRLGRYCALDLRKYQGENEKIRPNKNYQENGPERNAFIVYSDVIGKIPAGVAAEVVDAVGVFPGEELTLRIPFPGTWFVIVRREGRLSGPWVWTPNAEVAGCVTLKRASGLEQKELDQEEAGEKLLSMENVEGQTVTLCVDLSVFGVSADFEEPAPEPIKPIVVRPAAESVSLSVPTPAIKAPETEIAPQETEQPAPEPEKIEAPEPETPAVPEMASASESAAAPAESAETKTVAKPFVPIAAKPGAHPEQGIVKPTPVRFVAQKIVARTIPAESVRPQESEQPKADMPWLHRSDAIRPRAVSNRLSLREQAMQAQAGMNPRRGRSLHEVVDEQWRKSRYDQLGHPVPAEATGRPVVSPIERATAAVEQAWNLTEARPGLLSGLLGIQQMREAIAECLGLVRENNGCDKRDDNVLTLMEAEKLKVMGEIDALKQKRAEVMNGLLEELRASHKQEFDQYDARNKTLLEEIQRNEKAATSALESAEVAEDTLKQAEGELEKKLLDGVVSERAMAWIRSGNDKKRTIASHPDLYEPTAGQLISDLRVQMENAGFVLSNDEMINLLICARVGGMVILSGAPGSGKSELARRIAASLGLRGVEGRYIELRSIDDKAFDDLIDNCDRLTPVIALYDDINLDEDNAHVNALLRLWERARENDVPLCLLLTAQDPPEGVPLSARLLSRAFFIRLERAPYDTPWKPSDAVMPAPGRAVSFEAFDSILKPAADLETGVEIRLNALRAGLNKLGWTLDRRTLDQLWRYCSIAANLMKLSGAETLDLALSQRALPEMLAAMDLAALHELPNLFCDMPRCLRLMDQPLPLPPL